MSSLAKAQQPTSYALNCPDCGRAMQMRKSRFKNSFWYACELYPQCKGSHGAHPDGRPLGKPADRETKDWRIKAHATFDPIFEIYQKGKARRQARWRAYQWMAFAMGLDIERAHIGEFTAGQCQRLIALIKAEEYVIAAYPVEVEVKDVV